MTPGLRLAIDSVPQIGVHQPLLQTWDNRQSPKIERFTMSYTLTRILQKCVSHKCPTFKLPTVISLTWSAMCVPLTTCMLLQSLQTSSTEVYDEVLPNESVLLKITLWSYQELLP